MLILQVQKQKRWVYLSSQQMQNYMTDYTKSKQYLPTS